MDKIEVPSFVIVMPDEWEGFSPENRAAAIVHAIRAAGIYAEMEVRKILLPLYPDIRPVMIGGGGGGGGGGCSGGYGGGYGGGGCGYGGSGHSGGSSAWSGEGTLPAADFEVGGGRKNNKDDDAQR